MNYYPTELHCHSIHSDGDFKVSELQQNAKEYGLDVIALTDHNTKSGYMDITNTIHVINGMEWTTYFGHMLVLDGKNFVDWRSANIQNIDEKIAPLKDGGAVVGVAHPFQLGSPMCTGGRWEFNVHNWDNVDYIEIFHYSFAMTDENKRSYYLWHSLLDKGYKLAVTFGRDWHRKAKKMAPGCTYVLSNDDTPNSILSSIREGKTVPSVGAVIDFRVFDDDIEHTIGETLSEGQYDFKINVDLGKRQEYFGAFDIQYESIRIITNNDERVMQLPLTGENGKITMKSGHWYSVELWGAIDNDPAILAVTSPIYCQ